MVLIQDVFFLRLVFTCNTITSSLLFLFSLTLIRKVFLENKYLLLHRNTRVHRPVRSETILNQAENKTLANACKTNVQENVLESSGEFGLAPYPEMLVLGMLVNWQSLRLLSQK